MVTEYTVRYMVRYGVGAERTKISNKRRMAKTMQHVNQRNGICFEFFLVMFFLVHAILADELNSSV